MWMSAWECGLYQPSTHRSAVKARIMIAILGFGRRVTALQQLDL
jgi:hypothetical protein